MYYLVKVDENCKAILMDGEYADYESACKAQEAYEQMDDSYSYLIYTADEWIYERENGII